MASGVSGESGIPGACLLSGELLAEAFQDFQKLLAPGVWKCGASGELLGQLP